MAGLQSVKTCFVRICGLLKSILKAAFQVNPVAYFLWSWIFFGLGGGISFVFEPMVNAFFCSIPGREMAGGCVACPAQLALCNLPVTKPCYGVAMNITWSTDAKTPNSKYFDDFKDASISVPCFKKVSEAIDPLDMVNSIIGAPPNEGCKEFHCRVLAQATMGGGRADITTDLSDVYSKGTDQFPNRCSNTKLIKSNDPNSTDCTCNAVGKDLGYTDALRVEKFCGTTLANFSFHMLWKRFYLSSDCHGRTLERTWREEALKSSWVALKSAGASVAVKTTVGHMVGKPSAWAFWNVETKTTSTSGDVKTSPYDPPAEAKKVMCRAFDYSIEMCDWEKDPSLSLVKRKAINNVIERCTTDPKLGTETVDNLRARICSQVSSSSDQWNILVSSQVCDASWKDMTLPTIQSFTTTTTKCPGCSNSRLLEEEMFETEEPLGRWLQDAPSPAPEGGAPAPSASGGAELDPYEVGSWSKCSCYMQCVPGLSKRTVVCTNDECASPKPGKIKSCVCEHCAACPQARLLLTLCMLIFAGKTFLAFVCWALFMYVQNWTEENAKSIGMIDKFLGFFMRYLPVLMRMGLLLNVFLIVVVWAMYFGGSVLPMYKDCARNEVLFYWMVACLFFTLVPIGYGILVKKNSPMPPWLWTPPPRSKALKICCTPLRFVGP